MCGRYAASRRPEDLVEEFEIEDVAGGAGGLGGAGGAAWVDEDADPISPTWNVAPTDPVHVVLERAPKGEPPAAARRALRAVRWGLVPSWAKDASGGARMINARLETVAEKPAFKRAFAARRCLVPADGYYEWYASPEAAPRAPKQPFFISPRDGSVLAMAGLYELWRDPARSAEDPRRWLWTCTIITTRATDDVGRIHDRMPMLVTRDRWASWLDPTASEPDALLGLLTPAAPGLLEAWPVSPAVGNVRNDGPELVLPIAPETAAGDLTLL